MTAHCEGSVRCGWCGLDRPRSEFGGYKKSDRPNRRTDIPRKCDSCTRSYHREWARKKRLEKGMVPMDSPETMERIAKNQERERKLSIERLRKWSEKNKDRVKEVRSDAWRRFHERNPGLTQSINARKRATRLQATPKWGQEGIRELYAEAQERGMTVDHMIPLIHPLVCGLHVRANLQLLTQSENCAKGNRRWDL